MIGKIIYHRLWYMVRHQMSPITALLWEQQQQRHRPQHKVLAEISFCRSAKLMMNLTTKMKKSLDRMAIPRVNQILPQHFRSCRGSYPQHTTIIGSLVTLLLNDQEVQCCPLNACQTQA